MTDPDQKPRAPLTLVEDLTEVVDDLRDLVAELGGRPVRSFVLHYRWTGGERYRGAPELLSAQELTPRPELVDEDKLRAQVDRRGTTATGVVELRKISPRYSEADLDVLRRALPADEEVLVELVHDGRDGRAAERRAYRPAGKPVRDPFRFEWRLSLRAIVDARTAAAYRRDWATE